MMSLTSPSCPSQPSHNDKYSNPEIVRVMNELAKARKQLKGTFAPTCVCGSASVVLDWSTSSPQSSHSDSRCSSQRRTTTSPPTGNNTPAPSALPLVGVLTRVASCRSGAGQQGASEHKPTLEETVESLFRRLRQKRRDLDLPDNTKVRP